MADVRALLKAKTKEREPQIQHVYASYSAAGQLRCSLCGTTIKHSASWKPHLDSKAHRTNMAKEQERAAKKGKRKVEEEENSMDDVEETKRRKMDTPPPANTNQLASSGFPSDFFSDPSRSIPIPSNDDEEENADTPQVVPTSSTAIDSEWEAFERAISAPSKSVTTIEEAFQRATIFAEPELVAPVEDGFPPGVTDNLEEDTQKVEPGEDEPVETLGQIQKRKEQDEKELIMDRLLDEERAQEEADEKVRALKARLDAIKKQREAARAKKKAS